LAPQRQSQERAVATLRGSNMHASNGHGAGGSSAHAVHFYEDPTVLIDGLGEFVGSALGTGGACLVIATRTHREQLAERLKGWGFPSITRSNRYISLDAEETLATFMVDGWPDEELFCRVIEPALVRARAGVRRTGAPIVAFGEMVALLWAKGKCEAAIRLEQLWNKLAARHSFLLRCAYPMGRFGQEAHDGPFRQICAEHSHVIPSESYTSLDNEDERLRMVSSLQQKALTLHAVVVEREREIAQRKQVEEQLCRTEQFAQTVVESSIDCVKVLDLEGRLEYMSLPGQRALGIEDMSQFIGRRWMDFWKEEDRDRAEAAVNAARAGGVGSFQGDCLTMGGIPKSWDVKLTPARDKDGKIERLIAVSRDITELKYAQIAVMQAEKLAATGRLAATIAHEINNPLEAVTNLIYLAKASKGVPEEVRRQLEIADLELARVAQIAQQTLGFYRDNSKHKWISVAELIGEVMTIYERRLRYKQLDVEISADAELKLYTRAGGLKQALSNLMANAIDASNQGGKLWLRAQAAKNWTNGMEQGVRITLADNGSGMTREVQQRIFVPFFTTKLDVGTGIGLWITKSLIEKQGGYMRFRSRQGQKAGTVMSFFLPLVHEQRPGSGEAG
jgi:PAS domain S-box-containing protein